MGYQSGVFNTTQNPTELNMKSFAGTILRRFPNGSAPLFAMTAQSGRSKAKSTSHGYFTKTLSFVATTSSAALVGDTNITFASTAGFVEYAVLYNIRTGENVRVSSITSATVAAVTRGFGRVAAAAVNNADKWIMVGTAHPEGSNRPTARRWTTTFVDNYTQIFRNAWALTDTARASLAEAGYSNIAESRSDCMSMHSIDIESGIIWGQAKMDTSGAQPVHATQGIIDAMKQYAPTHVNAAGGTTNYAQLVSLVEPAYESTANIGSPTNRILVGDNTAIKVITDIGRKSGQVNIMQSETSFGMQFTRFQFYLGTLDLIIHPLFNGLGLSGTALVLDMAAVKLAYLEGRDTKSEEYNTGGKIVENGVDAVGGSLTTEFAVEYLNPYSGAMITGLTSGVAE